MRNIFILFLFIGGLMLTSCGKSSPKPEPACEEGGQEVTP